MLRIFKTAALSVALAACGYVMPATAALPMAVDGQALPTLAPMIEKVTPGVVNISTRTRIKAQENPLMSDPFFRRFFDLQPVPPSERESQSLGSGVIVDASKGYVITNHHVINKADEINVTLRDGRTLAAKLVGSDPEADVAVVQVNPDKLTAVTWGNSEQLRVGDFVVAVGNPFGLGQTVTSGIISALGRSGLGIEGYEDFIQTDASINPGNSGGALVNLRGELIGVNTAILGPSGGNIGIGFAIPANMVKDIMNQLVQFGEVRRGRLGVATQDLTPDLAKAFNIKVTQGAVIAQVVKGSPADKAGLRPGDVVVGINNRPINNAGQLRNIVGLLKIGDKIALNVVRDGEQKSIQAVIGEPEHAKKAQAGEVNKRLEGAVFGPIEENHPLHGQLEGVQVLKVEPGTPAWNAGLRQGDIIASANRQPVTSIEDLRRAVGKGENLLLNIRRGDGAMFILIR